MNRKLVLVALLLAACRKSEPPPPAAEPSGPPPPEQVAEQEPNDYLHAQQLPDRAVVSGTFAPPRPRTADDDWYHLSPGAGRTLALRVELVPTHGAELEVLDRDRNRLIRLRTAREPLLVPAVACVEGCFVRASSTEAGPYKLTILGAPPVDGRELEPNDRAVDATPLPVGKAVEGTYGWAEDEDWYRLEVRDVKPGQFLRVELTGVVGVRPELEVRALQDAALLATVRAQIDGDGLFLRDLGLALGAAPQPPRPTETAPGAPTTSPDAGSEPAPPPVVTSTPNAGATQSQPFAPESPDAGAAPAPPQAPAVQTAPAAGYYLVLRSASVGSGRNATRGANPRVPYKLTASVESGPEDLEQEPNDEPARATDLAPGGSRTGYLSPPGDVDWYRVHADQPSILHVEVSALERADVELSVLAPGAKPDDKPQLLARANEGGVREGEVLPNVRIAAGDSYVKVEGAAREMDGKWVRDAEDRDHAYRVSAQLLPDEGSTDREPNNDVATAQEVTLPARIRGWIWPKRDVDVFRFH
ncbi:MAG TPA: hypothetical protein VE620_11560, partial [Myxococcales bacterium]|nr:hypothetical protein [Myxococcales bacterium]